jgi:hypothetical protein
VFLNVNKGPAAEAVIDVITIGDEDHCAPRPLTNNVSFVDIPEKLFAAYVPVC